jgi:hypothetical protein
MANRKNELLDEISQLYEQYRKEVPGRRRPWPESLKSRVLELRGLGLNGRRIAERTKLPYHTVARWVRESKSPTFDLVKVVDARATEVGMVTDARHRSERVATVTDTTLSSVSTVTVALPSGVRVEGVSLSFLIALLPRLGAAV